MNRLLGSVRTSSFARLQCNASSPSSGASVGKRVLITGGNTGLGYQTAKSLCSKGYGVTIACRDDARAASAVASIREGQPDAKLESVQLDLGDLNSVQTCYENLVGSGNASFDVLLNNAGVMATPKMQTKDGYEYQLGVNHLGHFLLTNLLLPHLEEPKRPVRIINVASAAHITGSVKFDDLFRDQPGAYQPWEAYGQSKLANILFTYELARRLQDKPHITVNCLHPGVVRTELGRYMVNDQNRWYMGPMISLASIFFKAPEQGAQTSIYLASSPEVENVNSKYYVDCKPVASSAASYDKEAAKKLWDVSTQLTLEKLKVDAATTA